MGRTGPALTESRCVTRPINCFVPTKSAEQQSAVMLHGTLELEVQ
jgi:hypothetical protein